MVSHGEKIDAFTLRRSERLKGTNKYPEKFKLIRVSVSTIDPIFFQRISSCFLI
jgi:hypothetical protein